MRAMVISRFGGPDVFELQDRPRPVAGPGELLVRVVASGTNPVDAKIRQAGSWAGIPFPAATTVRPSRPGHLGGSSGGSGSSRSPTSTKYARTVPNPSSSGAISCT